MSREHAAQLIERAVTAGVFPAATAEVGRSTGVIWRQAFGTRCSPGLDATPPTLEEDARPATDDTLFDLASLTKPLSTATLAVGLIQEERLGLDDRVARYFDEWRGADREDVTIRDLLEHASGLPARLVDRPPATEREFVHEICTTRLEYPPRSRSVYSDLDFLLLGFLIARLDARPLGEQFAALWASLSPEAPEFIGAADDAAGVRLPIAPTKPYDGDDRKGRTLTGEVHDSYAAALGGGVAGHTGLFGNAPGVGRFARAVLRAARGDGAPRGPLSTAGVRLATTKTTVRGSSRALGWDTMLPTSSCGERLSPAAFGHVGFTGTSLWIDPAIDRYFVLLTNRAYGTGTLDEMRAVRRSFHDTLATIDG